MGICINFSDCFIREYLVNVFVYYKLCSLQAVQGMVEECCKYVHQTPNMEVKLKLIDTLRAATEGKVSLYNI